MSDAPNVAVALSPISGDPGLVEATASIADPVEREVNCRVTLRNPGDTAVRVDNPYEGLTYHLISDDGTPVEVKAPPSAAKVRAPRDPLAKRAYVDVVGATVEGTHHDVEEFIRASSFELGPGGALELSLAVRSSIDPSDRSVLDLVPAGDYHLVVMVRTVVEREGARLPLLLRTDRDLDVTVV